VSLSSFERRVFLSGSATALACVAARVESRRVSEVWTFRDLNRIGGLVPRVHGDPRIVSSPYGKATEFDGADDALFIDRHPLAGASRFTIEALFRPDGGAFEQRWLHLESAEGPWIEPGSGSARMLFEIRVVGARWYLDTFIKGPGYAQVLITPDKTHPLGRWYHVAQTFDGSMYRAFVNGVLQAEASVAFKPQGPGRASVGIRLNRVNPFRGAVRQASFLRGEALRPGSFRLPLPR
jgi:hypothetical protein